MEIQEYETSIYPCQRFFKIRLAQDYPWVMGFTEEDISDIIKKMQRIIYGNAKKMKAEEYIKEVYGGC